MNNDRFIIAKRMKQFIFSIDKLVINYPRKEFPFKDRLIADSLDILYYIYLSNSGKNYKAEIISKLSMLDFYLERSLKLGLISEKVCNKKSSELLEINKMIHGWIRSEC